MMDNILRLIRDNKRPQLYLPLSSFVGPNSSYLERGIFVKTRQWCRELDCPNGCGGLASVRKLAPGRYVAVCTHGPVIEEVEVPAEEVELCEFDAVAFAHEATPAEKSAMKVKTETRKDKNHSSREERQLNIGKLKQKLHDAAFGMLALSASDRKKAMREYGTGKYWAEATGIRPNSIGEIIDLRGKLVAKGGKPDDVCQLYFKVCSDETSFELFSEIEKGKSKPRNQMSVDEHARRLKNELEARMKK